MRYLPLADSDRKEMLRAIGAGEANKLVQSTQADAQESSKVVAAAVKPFLDPYGPVKVLDTEGKVVVSDVRSQAPAALPSAAVPTPATPASPPLSRSLSTPGVV